MLINNGSDTRTLTTSSGAASDTWTDDTDRRLVQIIIKPTTSDTQFDFKITDKNSLDIMEETNWTGKYSNVDANSIPQYVYGSFTLTISNATNDEAFTVLLVFSEETT